MGSSSGPSGMKESCGGKTMGPSSVGKAGGGKAGGGKARGGMGVKAAGPGIGNGRGSMAKLEGVGEIAMHRLSHDICLFSKFCRAMRQFLGC